LAFSYLDMDLSHLPDDQLLQLVQFAALESKKRAIAVWTAHCQCWSDTKEEIRNHCTVNPPNRNNIDIDSEGSTKATVIKLLNNLDFFSSHQRSQYSLNIWEKNGDVRLYLQEGFKTDGWKMTYFHTGNRWNLVGSVIAPSLPPHTIGEFRSFAKMLCSELPIGFKCNKNDNKYPVDHELLKQYERKL
jgi:hypothetical protein